MTKADTKREPLLAQLTPDPAPANLTPREWETMTLVRLGLSDKEIGQRMHIETCTVNAFLKRIFPKLGMHTRRQAAQKLFGATPQT
jgi:LuxR family transcriptional regulator, regulator of acetate metabolism